MGIMFTLFTAAIFVLVGLFVLFFIGGGIVILVKSPKPLPIATKIVAGVLILTGVMFANAFSGEPLESADHKARHTMKLPPEAVVTRFEYNDDDLGGTTVYFTLPQSQSCDASFAQIWAANVVPCKSSVDYPRNESSRDTGHWSATCHVTIGSGWSKKLEYNGQTREHRYVESAAD